MATDFTFNEETYAKAHQIAHGWFWYSDGPNIKNQVKQYLHKMAQNRVPEFTITESHYVAVICYFATKAQREDEQQ